MGRDRRRGKRAPLVQGVLSVGLPRGRQGPRHHLYAARRRDDQPPASLAVCKPAERPRKDHTVAARGPRKPQASQSDLVAKRRQIHAAEACLESSGGRRPRAKRLDGIGEACVPALKIRRAVCDVQKRRRPVKRARQVRKPVRVDAERGAVESGRQVAAASEQVKRARDVPFTAELPLLVLEEDVPHPYELHVRFELIRLLRPVTQIHIAAGDGLRPIRFELDSIQMNPGAVQEEMRFRVHEERFVVLNENRPAAERHGAPITRPIGDVQLDIARDDLPRHRVIVVCELAAQPAERLHGRREAARSSWLVLVASELRKVAPVLPTLDQHPPICHLDRLNRDFPIEHRGPVESDLESLRGEKGPVGFLQPFNQEVIDDDSAVEKADAQLADVYPPLPGLGSETLRITAHRGPQIHGD